MPNNRNQHYVPQVYLRQFSADKRGRSISLYNLRNRSVIHRASIKGQCSKPYFYGVEDRFEEGFQHIEGIYGSLVHQVKTGSALNAEQEAYLRSFLMIQMFRTPRQIEKISDKGDEFIQAIFNNQEVPREWQQSEDSIKLMAVLIGLDSIHITAHLKLVFLRAPARESFITSDNPVSFLNKYYIQRRRDRNFGYGNAGAIFLLPMTPSICAIVYDGYAYTIPRSGPQRFLNIRSSDVLKINGTTLIHAHKNIYGSNMSSEAVISLHREFGQYRDGFETRITRLVQRGDAPEVWVKATEEDTAPRAELLINSEYHPDFAPNLSFLRHRADFVPFDDGSAAGAHSSKEVADYMHQKRQEQENRGLPGA